MNPYDVYRNQDLETSNKEELVAKLFNEASVSLRRGIQAIDNKDFNSANKHIQKSQVIVSTLNNSLDMSFEVSDGLRKLYTYMLERMFKANINKDVTILAEISKMLGELRDTWLEAIRRSKKMQST